MKKLFNFPLLFIVFMIVMQGCYAPTMHQTAKTVDKNDLNAKLVFGQRNFPYVEPRNENFGDMPVISSIHIMTRYGITDNWEVGINLGGIESGINTKYQFFGDSSNHFDMALGLKSFTGKIYESAIDNPGEFSTMSGLELPLFMSVDVFPTFSFYLHPSVNFYHFNPSGVENFAHGSGDEAISIFHNPDFLTTGFYFSGVTGFYFQPKNSLNNYSIELSALKPIDKRAYRLSVSVGIGVTIESLFNGQ